MRLDCEPAPSFTEIPDLLKTRADLVGLDGHGWTDGANCYFGTGKPYVDFTPGYLAGGRQPGGIVAPVVVMAFCWGGLDPFPEVIARSLGGQPAAFLGSTLPMLAADADRIYTPILRRLGQLGSRPGPEHAYQIVRSAAEELGRGWRALMLDSGPGPAGRPTMAPRRADPVTVSGAAKMAL